jgi:hypothetical protein
MDVVHENKQKEYDDEWQVVETVSEFIAQVNSESLLDTFLHDECVKKIELTEHVDLPQDTSTLENTPENTPGDIPENTPEDIPENTPGDIPGDIPEDNPREDVPKAHIHTPPLSTQEEERKSVAKTDVGSELQVLPDSPTSSSKTPKTQKTTVTLVGRCLSSCDCLLFRCCSRKKKSKFSPKMGL